MSYLADIARSIKRYEPADKAALREFQKTYFGATSRQCDDEFFEWLFERNPNRDAERPSLWLCKRDGVVVGQQGSIPVVLKVGETEHCAAWLVDWMVHPDWRLKGVAPALLTANANNTELMLGLSLEDQPYRTVRRAGWKDVARLSLFVRPLDPAACAQALNMPTVLSKLVPRAVVRGSAHLASRISGVVTGVSIEPIDAFDERVDGVWAAASRDYPIIVKRDFRSLRWRFDEIPQRVLFDRYYFKRKGQVIGYGVVRLANWRGHVIGRVVDCFAERRWLASMFALLIERLSARNVIAVFIEQRLPRFDGTLRALGCFNMRAEHRQRFMYYIRDRESNLGEALARADAWFVMPGDADFDHNLLASES